MKKPWYLYSIIIIALFTCYLFLWDTQDIKITNINWDSKENPILTTFDIENKTNDYIQANLSIRALRRKAPANSPIGNRVTGEKIFSVKLAPREKRTIAEKVSVKYPPYTVQIKHWNLKKGLDDS